MSSIEVPRPQAPAADVVPPGDALLHALWRQRWWVIGCVAVCLLVATVYLLVAPPTYYGAAKIYVQPAGPRIMGDAKGQITDAAGQNFLNTQRELLTSTPILALAL